MVDKLKRTARGFKIYTEFIDASGNDVRVQESSGDSGCRVWVFTQKEETWGHFHLGEWVAHVPYLSKPQAKKLAKALLRFASEK